MGFFSRLFGLDKPVVVEEIVEPVVEEPVVVEPPKTEAERALEKFEGELTSAGTSVEKARDTLYDQKAQLAARYNAIYALEGEIDGYKLELADVERQYATCLDEERANLEIKGQRLQNTISRKQQQLVSEQESLNTFKATIDVLERTVENSECELNNKRSNLAAARTAVAVIELNEDIKENLANDRMAVLDNNSLDVFFEKQKLLLNDIENEVVPTAVNLNGAYALPFKSRMADGEVVND